MLKLPIKKIEKQIGKIKKNTLSMGIDTASRTGWCIIKVNTNYIYIDYGVVHIDSKDVNFKYTKMIEFFDGLIKPEYKVILEDTFLGMKFMNPYMFKYLSKLGGILFAVCKYKKVEDVSFLMACSARKNIGIKGNSKKSDVHQWLESVLGVNITDEDASDAIVLALNGIIEKPKYIIDNSKTIKLK